MKIDLMKKNLLYVLSINREFATKVSTKRRISLSNIYDGNFCQIVKLKTTNYCHKEVNRRYSIGS